MIYKFEKELEISEIAISQRNQKFDVVYKSLSAASLDNEGTELENLSGDFLEVPQDNPTTVSSITFESVTESDVNQAMCVQIGRDHNGKRYTYLFSGQPLQNVPYLDLCITVSRKLPIDLGDKFSITIN